MSFCPGTIIQYIKITNNLTHKQQTKLKMEQCTNEETVGIRKDWKLIAYRCAVLIYILICFVSRQSDWNLFNWLLSIPTQILNIWNAIIHIRMIHSYMGCSTCDFTQYEILILIVNHCSILSLFVATYLVLFQKLLGLRVVSSISRRRDSNSTLFHFTGSTLWLSSLSPGCKCCSPLWWWISFPLPMSCTCIGLVERVFRIGRIRFVCP